MSLDMLNPNIINFRYVVNDAVCHRWDPMPEVQPPTITALLKYLPTCGWANDVLSVDAWLGDGFVLRYGLRRQFWLPTAPTADELKLIESFSADPGEIACPFCQQAMRITSELTAGEHEENYLAVCDPCDIRIGRNHGLAMTARTLANVINAAKKKHK